MTYIVLFAGISNIFLAMVAIRYGKISKSIYSFATFCFLTGLWVIFNYLQSVYNYEYLVRLTYAFSSAVTTCLFGWAYFYASHKRDIKYKAFISYLIYLGGAALFSVIAFSTFVVADVSGAGTTDAYIVKGLLFGLWAIITLVFYISSIFLIVNKYFSEKLENRKKDLHIIWGLLGFGLVSMLANVILPLFGISDFTKLGPPSSLLFVVFTFIAIVKNQFLDIKLLIVQMLAIIIIAISLVDVTYARSVNEFFVRLSFFGFVSVASVLLVRNIELEITRKLELEVANAQLHKLDESKSEFLSIASHQLRTPLTASNGFVSMIFEGLYGEIPEKLVGPLKHVNKANKRLLGLIEDLLNVSRIESGRLAFNFKEEKMEDILKEAVEPFYIIAEKKNLGLVLSLPEKSLPLVFLDRVKIIEAISNTIDNAIKYSEKGTVTIDVTLHGEYINIVVQDTGIGILEEDLPNVFEKFTRGTSQNRLTSTGTGLGLYFGKKVIEANNGKIRVESDGPGLGSRFVIEIPTEFVARSE